MSRYLILVLLCLPLVFAGLLGALVDYKTGRLSRGKFYFVFCMWLVILAGLISAKYLYQFLFTNHLTRTESLSLFDVIEITGIVYLLFIVNRMRVKADTLERRVQDMHQELAIRLATPRGK